MIPFEILKLMVIDFTYKDLIAIECTNKYLKNFIFKPLIYFIGN